MTLPSYKEAEVYLENPSACFQAMTVVKHMALLPKYSDDVACGVREVLNGERKLYNDELQGVLVAYNKVQIMQPNGYLFEEQPYLHFDISVDVIIFKPVVGCMLRGVVNKLGTHHVGCLVHSCFNAAISQPRFQGGDWEGTRLEVGQEFTFQVTKVISQNGVLFMRGVLPQGSVTATPVKKKASSLVAASQSPARMPGTPDPGEQAATPQRHKHKHRKGSGAEAVDGVASPSRHFTSGFASPVPRLMASAAKPRSEGTVGLGLDTDTITEQASDLLATLIQPQASRASPTSPCLGSDSGVSSVTSNYLDYNKSPSKKDKPKPLRQSASVSFVEPEVVATGSAKKKSKKRKRADTMDSDDISATDGKKIKLEFDTSVDLNANLSGNDVSASHKKHKKHKKDKRKIIEETVTSAFLTQSLDEDECDIVTSSSKHKKHKKDKRIKTELDKDMSSLDLSYQEDLGQTQIKNESVGDSFLFSDEGDTSFTIRSALKKDKKHKKHKKDKKKADAGDIQNVSSSSYKIQEYHYLE